MAFEEKRQGNGGKAREVGEDCNSPLKGKHNLPQVRWVESYSLPGVGAKQVNLTEGADGGIWDPCPG
jgi:hypothetical protein